MLCHLHLMETLESKYCYSQFAAENNGKQNWKLLQPCILLSTFLLVKGEVSLVRFWDLGRTSYSPPPLLNFFTDGYLSQLDHSHSHRFLWFALVRNWERVLPWLSAWNSMCVWLLIKNLPVKAGDPVDAGSMPVLGGSPGGGNSNPL